METNTLLYQIALTLIPGIGSVNGKNLVAYCGGVEAVFTEKKRTLLKIPGIGEHTVSGIINHNAFDRAEKEIEFINKFNIKPLFYLDSDYPIRLKQCADSPLILYYKGNANLNAEKVIGIVGTRKATEYGKEICRKLVEGFADLNLLIISGLAYGIDAQAHKASVDNSLYTVGVLGHGLDRIYPYANRNLAARMIEHGGVLTEYMKDTKPDFMNFPSRNRIIAGMCDAVIVVEAGKSGGALITADIADSYNREVFAVPGRIGDIYSEGSNFLIRTNRAVLVQSAEDIIQFLNWDNQLTPRKPAQRELFIELTSEEKAFIEALREHGDMEIDSLLMETGILPSKAAMALLNLEFEGIIRCLPGKVYRLL
jgi:DNA processing protein